MQETKSRNIPDRQDKHNPIIQHQQPFFFLSISFLLALSKCALNTFFKFTVSYKKCTRLICVRNALRERDLCLWLVFLTCVCGGRFVACVALSPFLCSPSRLFDSWRTCAAEVCVCVFVCERLFLLSALLSLSMLT